MDEQLMKFFEEAYVRLYGTLLSEERTLQEVEGINRLLRLQPGSSLLDLGCAYGRHSLILAQKGY
jgi:cyclopropane fatty-acyl-phospholipid synthase-like methyltransferase